MSPKKFFLFVLLCITVIVVVFGIRFYPQYEPIVYNQLKEWKLVPLPEPLTELFFENHLQLPSQVGAEDDISFSFTIHNVEYESVSYPYTVTLKDEQERLATQGSVLLAHDASTTIPVTLIDPQIATRTAVVVSLTNRPERIHFWVEPR